MKSYPLQMCVSLRDDWRRRISVKIKQAVADEPSEATCLRSGRKRNMTHNPELVSTRVIDYRDDEKLITTML